MYVQSFTFHQYNYSRITVPDITVRDWKSILLDNCPRMTIGQCPCMFGRLFLSLKITLLFLITGHETLKKQNNAFM